MSKQPKDPKEMTTDSTSSLTTAELRQMLKEREASENKAAKEAKRKYDNEKQQFLKESCSQFLEVQKILEQLKTDVISQAEHYNAQKYILDDKEVKDTKSFELKNNDIKIVVEIQERFSFNDEAEVHIGAIQDIFRKKFEERNKGFYGLLDSILMRNTKGDYDAKLLTKARRQVSKIGDDKLTTEFEKLQDCLEVVGSSKYVRLYLRNQRDKWEDVSLNFSRL